MAQLFAMLANTQQALENKLDGIKANMETNTQAFRSDMRALWGETRQMGQCLQAGIMATPRAAMNELKGSAPAGEDRVIRETCWARSVKVMETVTERGKLIGVTETCTSETRREVTELTETRGIEKNRGETTRGRRG